MNTKVHKQQCRGSITVFLSLILVLILSLILTIIEGARVSTAKVYAERALSTAMDSVLAQYYGPLWNEYHIFGLYTGEGNDTDQSLQIEEKLIDYMSYTFHPDKDLSGGYQLASDEFFDISPGEVSVGDKVKLMDYQGELLINQAVEYMKYREAGDGIELLLNKLSLLETPEKVSYVYEEKQKVEEELIELDKGILQLMELLDGVKTSDSGIEITKQGKLCTVDYFVKKICLKEVTKESVGINQDEVFLALKNSYVNPLTEFELMKQKFTGLNQARDILSAIQSEKANVTAKLAEAQGKLDMLNAIEEKTDEDKQKIKDIKLKIKDLKADLRDIKKRANEEEKVIADMVVSINASSQNIIQLISGIKPKINKALSVLDGIILKTETVAPVLAQYEKFLYSQKEQISEEVFSGLEENLKEMKEYITTDENGYDFTGMKEILENNLSVLTSAESLLIQGKEELSKSLYHNAEISFEGARSEICSYQTSGLTLDYSTLVLDKASQENPISKMSELLQTGIAGMVIDPELISKNELKIETLPSDIAAMSDENIDFLSKLTSFFQNAVVGGNNSGLSSLFESFGTGSKSLSIAGQGINKAAELFLYQEYLNDHFGMYTAKEEGAGVAKPSVLSYEQEYLLAGNLTDQQNLSSVISRIVFLRTILDFVSILGDSTKLSEAKAAASALVGFTGLPILVGITQVMLLLAWSFAEALLDVCALMMGKEVPILKKKLVLEFPELFVINRSYLQSKAQTLTEAKELSFSYPDYLKIFLLMKDKKKLAYRSLDLMQENIRIRYDTESFQIVNCLFGYGTNAEFIVGSKFTGISFIQRFMNTDQEGFPFTIKAEYSY